MLLELNFFIFFLKIQKTKKMSLYYYYYYHYHLFIQYICFILLEYGSFIALMISLAQSIMHFYKYMSRIKQITPFIGYFIIWFIYYWFLFLEFLFFFECIETSSFFIIGLFILMFFAMGRLFFKLQTIDDYDDIYYYSNK